MVSTQFTISFYPGIEVTPNFDILGIRKPKGDGSEGMLGFVAV